MVAAVVANCHDVIYANLKPIPNPNALKKETKCQK